MQGSGADRSTVPAHPDANAEEPGTERKEQIVAAFADGGVDATFSSIGEPWGISGERVRQIVVEWEARTGQRLPRTSERRRAARLAAEEARRKRRPSIAQRLAAHVRPVPGTDCWEWIGPLMYPSGRPYPRFKALGEQFAHRVAYQLWCGPIPPDHVVLQACQGEICINPFHLFAIDRAGALRSWRRDITVPPLTHCKRGHELTPENTLGNTTSYLRDGVRISMRTRLCRICANERQRRHYKKPPRRPPLPEDENERAVEMSIRRIENARVADRREILKWELTPEVLPWEKPPAKTGHITARPGETWEDYERRTAPSGTHADWRASRILNDPRVVKMIAGTHRQDGNRADGE
jgi:hypothetical protein